MGTQMTQTGQIFADVVTFKIRFYPPHPRSH